MNRFGPRFRVDQLYPPLTDEYFDSPERIEREPRKKFTGYLSWALVLILAVVAYWQYQSAQEAKERNQSLQSFVGDLVLENRQLSHSVRSLKFENSMLEYRLGLDKALHEIELKYSRLRTERLQVENFAPKR